MTTPLEVACDALRSDASAWAAAADSFEAATATADALTLGPEQLGVIAQNRGIITAYDGMRAKLTGLLGGGTTEFDTVSTTLMVVADTYQREDAEGAHTITQAGG